MDSNTTDRIISLTRAGVRRRDIAAQLGVSVWTVSQVRRAAGLRHAADVIPGRQKRVRELHADGMTAVDIARELGWTIGTIEADLKAGAQKV